MCLMKIGKLGRKRMAKINGINLEVVYKIKYLVVYIKNTGGTEDEVKDKIQAMSKIKKK